MNFNKEVYKGPLPVWTIVLGAIFGGGLFCFLSISENDYIIVHLVAAFILGSTGFIYLWCLARLAKNPTPWLRKNFGLITTIGGLINAILIIWAILSKK